MIFENIGKIAEAGNNAFEAVMGRIYYFDVAHFQQGLRSSDTTTREEASMGLAVLATKYNICRHPSARDSLVAGLADSDADVRANCYVALLGSLALSPNAPYADALENMYYRLPNAGNQLRPQALFERKAREVGASLPLKPPSRLEMVFRGYQFQTHHESPDDVMRGVNGMLSVALRLRFSDPPLWNILGSNFRLLMIDRHFPEVARRAALITPLLDDRIPGRAFERATASEVS